MEKYFQKAVSFFLYLLLFIFPLFFLPFTQEFFITSKLYLLGFGVLLLLLLSTVSLLLFKKISWQKYPFDNLVLLFLATLAISIVFSSPNKVQVLLNLNFGLVMMISLTVLYFYLSRTTINFYKFLQISTVFLSVLTIIFFFQPFKNLNLPQSLSFLKNPGFNPVGSQLDLAILLGFFVIYQTIYFISNEARNLVKRKLIINYSLLTINLLALFLTVYSLIRAGRALPLQLPPFRLSWYAALEVLKNTKTAFFGVGIDNFSSVFTRVKDLAYNQSSLWQVNSFNISRSAILHIFTETGILGLIAFGLLIFSVSLQPIKKLNIPFLYIIICLFIFPTSLIIWFLFFVTLGVMNNNETIKQSFDLSDLPLLYLGIVVVIFGLISISSYFLVRSYESEYYFKKSLDGIVKNNLKEVYDNQRRAIILNPYIERFRSNFAQTNLIIANNLVQKQAKKITEQDKQTVTQAIQAAIAEAKAVVSLNSQKADNWKNLADIYHNIISVAQGSDVWAISAYQRAIILDPQNPLYRIDLGGIYYSLGKYDEAIKFFEQATGLKPNWPNAQYNYAWASYQKGSYSQAALAMQNVLNLLNPKINKTDYEKAQKDLKEFKKKLPKTK